MEETTQKQKEISLTDVLKLLLSKIKLLVPEFTEEKMPLPSGYSGTDCFRDSRTDAIKRTNEDLVWTTAVKYGLLLAVIALILACVVIVIVDRSDKRLRSVDQVTELFNVPVLGIIPTIKTVEKTEEHTTEVRK